MKTNNIIFMRLVPYDTATPNANVKIKNIQISTKLFKLCY
jgi:hypothetical protein